MTNLLKRLYYFLIGREMPGAYMSEEWAEEDNGEVYDPFTDDDRIMRGEVETHFDS